MKNRIKNRVVNALAFVIFVKEQIDEETWA